MAVHLSRAGQQSGRLGLTVERNGIIRPVNFVQLRFFPAYRSELFGEQCHQLVAAYRADPFIACDVVIGPAGERGAPRARFDVLNNDLQIRRSIK